MPISLKEWNLGVANFTKANAVLSFLNANSENAYKPSEIAEHVEELKVTDENSILFSLDTALKQLAANNRIESKEIAIDNSKYTYYKAHSPDIVVGPSID